MHPDATAIRTQFAALRQQQQRHRDIARQLGISEGALLHAHINAPHDARMQTTPLLPDWVDMLAALPALGEVMALTRNAACVHEVLGVYPSLHGHQSCAAHSGNQGHGMHGVHGCCTATSTVQPQLAAWSSGYAVRETDDTGATQHSLQFFDADGTAIHKVFLRAASQMDAYAAMLQRFIAHGGGQAAHAPQPAPEARACPASAPVAQAAHVDAAALRQQWLQLRTPDDFDALLRRFGLTRLHLLQTLHQADPQFAQPVEAACAHRVLDVAAHDALPLRISVQNPGAMQARMGLVQRIAVMGPWLNVLDPTFNLHLREDMIASAWVMKKPSVHGLCLSLELFDTTGNPIATIAGVPQPVKAESCGWCALMDDLVKEYVPCTA